MSRQIRLTNKRSPTKVGRQIQLIYDFTSILIQTHRQWDLCEEFSAQNACWSAMNNRSLMKIDFMRRKTFSLFTFRSFHWIESKFGFKKSVSRKPWSRKLMCRGKKSSALKDFTCRRKLKHKILQTFIKNVKHTRKRCGLDNKFLNSQILSHFLVKWEIISHSVSIA